MVARWNFLRLIFRCKLAVSLRGCNCLRPCVCFIPFWKHMFDEKNSQMLLPMLYWICRKGWFFQFPSPSPQGSLGNCWSFLPVATTSQSVPFPPEISLQDRISQTDTNVARGKCLILGSCFLSKFQNHQEELNSIRTCESISMFFFVETKWCWKMEMFFAKKLLLLWNKSV